MREGEKGFTYPFTLMLLLLFLLCFSMRIEWLMAERRMAHENFMIMQEEYYYHSTVRKIEKIYQLGTPVPAKSTFVFSKATMEYQSENPVGTVQRINFTLTLNTGEKCITRGFFDLTTKKLTKWVELK
jgi:hypothetical protein